MSVLQQLIFVDRSCQIQLIREYIILGKNTSLVAVTSEALHALEKAGLPHSKVSDYADLRKLAAVETNYNTSVLKLTHTIEQFIAEQYEPAKIEGSGFLSGQAYYIQFSVAAIATRVFLMRETILALSPKSLILVDDWIDPWFQTEGYCRNPWIDIIWDFAQSMNISVDLLKDTSTKVTNTAIATNQFEQLSAAIERAEIKSISLKVTESSLDLQCSRLLFVGNALQYEWGYLLRNLVVKARLEWFLLKEASVNNQPWGRYFIPELLDPHNQIQVLPVRNKPDFSDGDYNVVKQLIERWFELNASTSSLIVLGMNLLPALRLHLQALARIGLPIIRYTDKLSALLLDSFDPHAVCFFAMPWLAAKRLAYQCHLRSIPVLNYQHGGSYGTHSCPSHLLLGDWGDADYFLSYGSGICPPALAFQPTRARFVPIGSTRIEQFVLSGLLPSKSKGILQVLWIGEASTGNTVAGAFQVEDTTRYFLQKQCLSVLGKSELLHTVYRPFPCDLAIQATPLWLEMQQLQSISINISQTLVSLIQASDIAIVDSSSGTTWSEVIALKTPLVVYCDPQQTRLMPHFAADLEQACYWCKTGDELLVAVRRLAHEGERFVQELRQFDTSDFIRKYILHREDGQCVHRVVSFLEKVCRDRQPLEQWQKEWDEKLVLTDRALELSREAERLVADGRHCEAIALYHQALETQPDLEILYPKLIALYEQDSDLSRAAPLRYQQYSLRFSSATAQNHYDLGNQFQQLGDLQHAEDCYRRAIALDPSLARAYLKLGRSLAGQRKLGAALRWYIKAVLLKLRYKLGLST